MEKSMDECQREYRDWMQILQNSKSLPECINRLAFCATEEMGILNQLWAESNMRVTSPLSAFTSQIERKLKEARHREALYELLAKSNTSEGEALRERMEKVYKDFMEVSAAIKAWKEKNAREI